MNILIGSLVAWAVTGDVPVQGMLTDATGLGVHGNRDLTFRLYHDPNDDGTPDLIVERTQTVGLNAGSFAANLEAVNFDALDATHGLWVSVQLGPEGPSALAPLGWAPRATFAAVSGSARALGDLLPDDVVTWADGYLPGAGLSLTDRTFSVSSVAASLITGTLPDARLAGTYSAALSLTNPTNVFVGNGAGLTGLDAARLTTGGLPDARLAGTYSNVLTLSNTANTLAGNGAGITSLNANNLATGTVPVARLPATLARTDATSAQTFAGPVGTWGDPLGTDGRYFGEHFVRGFTAQAGGPLTALPSVQVVNLSDAPVGTEALRINGYVWAHGPMLPLDRDKTYETEMSFRWLGDGSPGTFYYVVQEYDANGATINGDGTNWYYPTAFTPSTTAWRRFRYTIGPNGGKQHAANARFISIGFIVNYTTGNGTYELNGFRIKPLPSCPTGMVNVGAYCIDKERGDTSETWQAQAGTCAAQGKRMCSMAEWIGACRNRASNGMIVPDNNTEYVDEYWVMNYTNGNYYSSYVSVGGTSCDHVFYSNWGCENTTCYSTTNPGKTGYHRRCCY